MNIARIVIAGLLLLTLDLPRLGLSQEARAEETPSWAGVVEAELFWQLPIAPHDSLDYQRARLLTLVPAADDGFAALLWFEHWPLRLWIYRVDGVGRIVWVAFEETRDFWEYYRPEPTFHAWSSVEYEASLNARLAVGPKGEVAFCDGADGISLYAPGGSLRWRRLHGRLEDCSLLTALSDSSILIGGKVWDNQPAAPIREVGLMLVLPDGHPAWRMTLPIDKEAAWPILPAELPDGSITLTIQSPWVREIYRSEDMYALALDGDYIKTWQLRVSLDGEIHPPDQLTRSPPPPDGNGRPLDILVTDARQLIRSFGYSVDEQPTEQWLQTWSSDGSQLIETRRMTESPAPDGRIWSPYVSVLFSGEEGNLYLSRRTGDGPPVRGICKMSSDGGQSCVRIDFPDDVDGGSASLGYADLFFVADDVIYRVPIAAIVQ